MRRFGVLVVLLSSLLISCSDDVAPSSTINKGSNSNNMNNTTNTNTGLNNDIDLGTDTDPMATPCDTNAECSAPEICVIDLATGEGTCGPNIGGGTGDACTTGSDCASGICLNDQCANPCGSESDCPAGFECATSTIPLTGGGSVELDVCVPEAAPCLSNNNCSATDVCVVDRSGAAVALECAAPVGGGVLGTACANDNECASNLCLSGSCTQPCERPTDCAADGSYLCDAAAVTLGAGGSANVNVCQVRPGDVCLSDAQCAGGERCVATRSATDIEFNCGNANVGAETGGACTADADCTQNLCVGGVCAGPCQGNGDCTAAADFTCELSAVDLGNNVTDNAQICVPPVTCAQNDDCKATEVCYLRASATGVDLFCRAKNVGGGNLGQVCSNAQECANNHCLDTRFRDVCAVPCVDSTDCTRSGYVCQNTDVTFTNGSEPVKMCVPGVPTACTSNNSCATQTTCAVIPTVAATALETVCVPQTGGDSTGVACTVDSNCASLVCLGGFCAAPCNDSTQCAASQLCQSTSLTKGNATGSFDVCTTLPSVACADSGECTDGVRVCSDLRLANNIFTPHCAFPNTTAVGMMGAACTAPNQCRENICLSPAGACSVVCNSDNDCATGMGCTTYSLSSNNVTSTIGFCIDVCADNSDCSNGNVCSINSDVINDDVDQVCEKPVGAKDLGDTCATGNECLTGLCLRTLAYNTTACTTNAACGTGEVCSCPVDDANCQPAAKRCATEEFACTRVCNDNGDCSMGAVGNALTVCSTDTVVTRPVSMTAKTISTCSRP
jgi:hypothetical protein